MASKFNSNSANRPDVYQIVTDRIVEMLEKGTVPWRKPWSTAGSLPKNLVSQKAYSGINPFLLMTAPYDSQYWLTYKQAQDLGGHVKKGEKGTPIVFYKTYQKEVECPDDPDAPNFETRYALRHYTVFNVEQCDGIDYEEPEITIYPENERIEKAENVQLFMPNRPVVTYGGSRAYYRPHMDSVTIPELNRFEKPEYFYSTLFHELAHSTGHKSRLNREGITGIHSFGDSVYSREELVAEMTAAFLCAHCGIENSTIENSAAYLQSWIKVLKGDKKLAIKAGALAQKAANYILNIKPE